MDEPSEARPQAAWRNPAWIAAVAGLIAALGGIIGLFVVKSDGGSAPSPPAADTATTTKEPSEPITGSKVAANIESADAPLTVNVETVQGGAGDAWTFPPGGASPDEFTGTTGDELRHWLGVNGRVGGLQTLELTLRGTSAEPVVIRGLRVSVVEAAQPDAASGVEWGYGCGVVPVREAYVNLEDPSLQFRWTDESGTLPKAPTLRVDTTDIEVVNVAASVQTRDVSWRLIVEYEFGGASGELVLDDNGRPFHVTSATVDTEPYRVAETYDSEDQSSRVEMVPDPDTANTPSNFGRFC